MEQWSDEQRRAFGQRLSEAREDAGLTQSAVAFEFGLKTRGTPHLWEKGQNMPSTETVARLAELFNVPVQWLITGTDSWPLSRDLLSALMKADPQVRRRVENAARSVLGQEPIPAGPLDQQPLSAIPDPQETATHPARQRVSAAPKLGGLIWDAMQADQSHATPAPAAAPIPAQRAGRKKRDAAN